MIHSNPLAIRGDKNVFITTGEIMLRLTPPNYGKIRVASTFEASCGGSEANIALALANPRIGSTFSAWCPTTPRARAPSGCSATWTW